MSDQEELSDYERGYQDGGVEFQNRFAEHFGNTPLEVVEACAQLLSGMIAIRAGEDADEVVAALEHLLPERKLDLSFLDADEGDPT